MTPPIRILFLCTGNSARSILAEALANVRFGDSIRAVSAGSSPRGSIHPLAIETLHENGIATDALASESWETYRDEPLDLVITLCGDAAETCPVFPAGPTVVHWGFPDPPLAPDPARAFAEVFRTLCEALEILTSGAAADLDRAAQDAAAYVRRACGG